VQYPKDTSSTRTSYTYDSMYRLTKAQASDGQSHTYSATYTYDDAGNMPNGEQITEDGSAAINAC